MGVSHHDDEYFQMRDEIRDVLEEYGVSDPDCIDSIFSILNDYGAVNWA